MLPKIDYSNEKELSQLITSQKAYLHSLLKNDISNTYNDLLQSIKEKTKILQKQKQTNTCIPSINMSDILQGNVDNGLIADFEQKGAVIIRNVIDKEEISSLYEDFKKYLIDNDYNNQKVSAEDNYFGELKSKKPQIFDIFWSQCQVQIRQNANLALAKQFLNNSWAKHTQDKDYFDFTKECIYSDRIRKREPKDNTLGLSPHIDGGSVERWLDSGYVKTYQSIFESNWREHNPYDASFHKEIELTPAPAVCTAFRTFQGWIALTEQGENDGTLQVIPMLKEATAYLLLRPFLADIEKDILCGAQMSRAQNISGEFHKPLLDALVSIPVLYPGDTIWWHCDLVHAVENEHQGANESSVTYIGSAPLCKKNTDFLQLQKEAFLCGKSSPDFAPMNREENYINRASLEELSTLGKKQMGFLPWE